MKRLITQIEAFLMKHPVYVFLKTHQVFAHVFVMLLYAQLSLLLPLTLVFLSGMLAMVAREVYGVYTTAFDWSDIVNGLIGLLYGMLPYFIYAVYSTF